MKTKSVSRQTTAIARQIKHSLIALATAGGLVWVGSARAQYVTGDQYLDNLTIPPPSPGAVYSDWTTSDLSDGPTGLTVSYPGEQNGGEFGSMYYVIPGSQVQYPINTADNAAVLTLTFNSASGGVPPNWIGVYFTFGDNAGATPDLGGYGGSGNPGNPSNWVWNGDMLTITAPLPAAQIAAINAAGGDAVYSFNLGIDPSPLPAPGSYNLTFNSLELVAVPEPAGMALLALGAAGLMAIRRRK
ncbi:MAG: PEP-CTERM sorting domain-containing protein [Limisphaerales bacterium]